MGGEPDFQVINRMQAVIQQWEAAADPRAFFLRCYSMMTRNTLAAVASREFNDPDWVNRLLHRFADYYFVALAAYDRDPTSAPAVWQMTFEQSSNPRSWALQKLFLGVNAHINYDLVLALADELKPEWEQRTDERLGIRYADHCQINQIITRTIDAVQDQVLEPSMPGFDLIDIILGRTDEWMISRLITNWRDTVWKNAIALLDMQEVDAQMKLIREVEQEALRRARAIRDLDWLELV